MLKTAMNFGPALPVFLSKWTVTDPFNRMVAIMEPAYVPAVRRSCSVARSRPNSESEPFNINGRAGSYERWTLDGHKTHKKTTSSSPVVYTVTHGCHVLCVAVPHAVFLPPKNMGVFSVGVLVRPLDICPTSRRREGKGLLAKGAVCPPSCPAYPALVRPEACPDLHSKRGG